MAKTPGNASTSAAAATTSTPAATATTPAPPSIPPTPAKPADDPKDPMEIQVLRFALPEAGKFRLFARVLNYKGNGLNKKKVGFIFRGVLEEIETNARGVCQFPKDTSQAIYIDPGKEEKITAFVSGITALTTSNICRRRELTPTDIAKNQANNQRARIFFAIAGIGFVVWILSSIFISIFYGWGEPILSTKDTLGHWQKTSIFLPFGILVFWTISSFIYGMLSTREEVAEAWRSGMESLVDKHFVRSQDPLFERIAAWTGHLSRAKSQPTASNSTPTSTPAEDSRKPFTFWDSFRSDLISDFIIEILPKIFGAIIRRK